MRDRHAVARQMRLRHDYGGLYVAYLPARTGVYVIATARPGIDDIYAKIEEAGGITRAERSQVVIDIPMPGENEQACIWSPRAAESSRKFRTSSPSMIGSGGQFSDELALSTHFESASESEC